MSKPQDKPLWKPSSERVKRANMTRFMEHAREEYDAGIDSYAALHRWSIERPEVFWPAVWAFCGIRASRTWDTVLTHGDQMPGARWFEGSRLNFAENLLRYRDERTALVFRGEQGHRESL
ncbi:MAG: acetyl-coenzyme A synthetase N-terminal domain-containing protein, partial [Gammaproteobacteria bacterium]